MSDKKDSLIGRQQLQIEDLKTANREASDLLTETSKQFVAIGKPLNDNNLRMNKEQLMWCRGVYEAIAEVEIVLASGRTK